MTPELLDQISKTAKRCSFKLRGNLIEAGDLENEAVLAALRGRKSITGPMQDYIRQQQIVGSYRKRNLTHPQREPLSPDLAVASHENSVVSSVTLRSVIKQAKLSPREAETIPEMLDGSLIRTWGKQQSADKAREMGISMGTYYTHRSNAMKKLRKLCR